MCSTIAPDQRGYQELFAYFHKNVCCGCSLEASQQGASNEYSQHMFSWKTKKNINSVWLKMSVILENRG